MTGLKIERLRVERLAYSLWEERGRPAGTSTEDWYRAEQMLGVKRSRCGFPLFAFGVERWTA